MAKSGKRSNGSLDPARDKSAKQVKFTRATTHQASPGEDDASDSEVDVGRLESQQFLAMTRTATKQKASKQADIHKSEFQKMLEGMKEKTIGTLKENAVDVLERSAVQNAALAELLSACCRPNEDDSSNLPSFRRSSLTKSSSFPAYSKATALLALSRELLHMYEETTDHLSTKARSLPVGENWEHDCRMLHGVLQAGRKVTEDQVYERVRGGSRLGGDAGVEDTADRDAPDTWTTFGVIAGEHRDGLGWASTAKSAEKNIRRLVKQIPVGDH